jgi:hypothetical protein
LIGEVLSWVPSFAQMLYALLYVMIALNVFASTFGSRDWNDSLKAATVTTIYAVLIRFAL